MEDYKIICNNLEKFADKELKQALIAALEKACLIVEADAKEGCPVGDGQLRQSITHEIDEKKLIGYVGSIVDYAPYVEIGTGIYSTEGTGRKDAWVYKDEKSGNYYWTVGQPPHPFLQPAMEQNKDKIQKCFEGIV